MKALDILESNLEDVQSVIDEMYSDDRFLNEYAYACELLQRAVKDRKRIFVAGNGGSAADAQHFVAELVVKYEKERSPINAESLTTDTSVLTAHSNDFDYNTVFSRQLIAKASSGDVFIGISTSGNSKNIIMALEVANNYGVSTILLTGKDGGTAVLGDSLGELTLDAKLIVPSQKTATIQTAHQMIYHSMAEYLESLL